MSLLRLFVFITIVGLTLTATTTYATGPQGCLECGHQGHSVIPQHSNPVFPTMICPRCYYSWQTDVFDPPFSSLNPKNLCETAGADAFVSIALLSFSLGVIYFFAPYLTQLSYINLTALCFSPCLVTTIYLYARLQHWANLRRIEHELLKNFSEKHKKEKVDDKTGGLLQDNLWLSLKTELTLPEAFQRRHKPDRQRLSIADLATFLYISQSPTGDVNIQDFRTYMIYEACLKSVKNRRPHSAPTHTYGETTELLQDGKPLSVEQLTKAVISGATVIVDYGLSQIGIRTKHETDKFPQYEVMIPRISYYQPIIVNESQLTEFLNNIVKLLKESFFLTTEIAMDIYYPETLIKAFERHRDKQTTLRFHFTEI